MLANIISLADTLDPWDGVLRYFSFSEGSHVAYQINRDEA